jgi:septum formation protein
VTLVLASASPRRRELLATLGVQFIVCPANVNEDPLAGESPLETQHRITLAKAQAATRQVAEGMCIPDAADAQESVPIIACDTTVLLDGDMLNKPADTDEAWHMLRRLRNRMHEVQSALVIQHGKDIQAAVITSRVMMRNYSDAEIEAYIGSGDPFDKAGGYAVQHAGFQPVSEIRGCPLNVIGLSLCHLRACMPDLPDCAQVCAAYFGKPCPSLLDDPSHVVSGQMC